MDLELRQKVFLITGGSMGLGRALAQRLVAEGARVALMARDGERLNATAEALREARAAAAGITPVEYYERMVADCRIPLGRVGRAGEYGDVGAFLLSSRASYVTGSAVNLDGGLCPVV